MKTKRHTNYFILMEATLYYLRNPFFNMNFKHKVRNISVQNQYNTLLKSCETSRSFT